MLNRKIKSELAEGLLEKMKQADKPKWHRPKRV